MRLRFLLPPFALLVGASAVVAVPAEPNCPPQRMPTRAGAQPAVQLFPVLAQVQPAAKKYPRGHKLPSKHVSAQRHRVSNAKFGAHLRALPVATQAAYDAYTAAGGSCVPPILNQAQCGDCYIFSGMKVCSAAQMVAGTAKPGSGFMLSPQWALDCHPELGGCDGGDEYQVSQTVQSDGAPSLADYPGGGNVAGQPKPTTGMTLYSVSSLVYCDPTQTDQGVASTQSIKNAILAYSYVSVAVAAGSGDWDAYQGGTITGRSTDIDHAVGLTGWDDGHDNGDGTKGAWLCDNQWDTTWGNKGRAWVKYGADQIGTEAYFALVNAPQPTPTPTPTPTPQPPGPAPVPPAPAPAAAGFTGVVAYTYVGGVLTNVTSGTSATDLLAADLKGAGINLNVVADVVKIITDIKTKAGAAALAADALQLLIDLGVVAAPKVGRLDVPPKAEQWAARVELLLAA